MRQTFKHLEPSFLMEYEKGGGNGAMMAMMMMMQQQQEAERIRQEKAAEQAKLDKIAEEKAAALEKQGKIDKSTGRVNKAYTDTLAQAERELSAMGYSGNALQSLMKDFTSKMDTTRSGLPEIVENANDYFNTNALSGIVDLANQGYDTKLNKDLDAFLGSGFETKAFADTADDAYINAIMDEQFGDAQSKLDSALARGAINDSGYAAGLKELSRQRSMGMTNAQKLGGDILTGYRGGLTDYAKDTRKTADALNFGDVFDLEGAQAGLEGKIKGYQGSLEGDIQNAIGGTDFFDIAKLIGKAGSGGGILGGGMPQSSVTSSTPNTLTPLDVRSPTEEEKRRNEGVF